MDTISAFAMGQRNQGKPQKIFDWVKAAKIIKERNPESADAGLQSDLEWTAGTIWQDGEIVTDSYTYLSSNWATPVLVIDDEEIPCFVMQSDTEWDELTKWPKEARELLEA